MTRPYWCRLPEGCASTSGDIAGHDRQHRLDRLLETDDVWVRRSGFCLHVLPDSLRSQWQWLPDVFGSEAAGPRGMPQQCLGGLGHEEGSTITAGIRRSKMKLALGVLCLSSRSKTLPIFGKNDEDCQKWLSCCFKTNGQRSKTRSYQFSRRKMPYHMWYIEVKEDFIHVSLTSKNHFQVFSIKVRGKHHLLQ